MKRGAVLVIASGLVAVVVIGLRRYDLASLSPTELAVRQPKPPELPKDCSELRRALTLSTRSWASGHERAIEITALRDSDEDAIYLAVIQRWRSGSSAGLHVSSKTFPLDMTSFSEGPECGCLAGFPADSLLRASHSFHTLTRHDLPMEGIRPVSPDEQNEMIARNDPGTMIREGRPVTEAVDHAFKNALFSLSEIVFDTDRRHALVSYAFHCGELCGSGSIWVFEKVNGQWKKTALECGGWIS